MPERREGVLARAWAAMKAAVLGKSDPTHLEREVGGQHFFDEANAAQFRAAEEPERDVVEEASDESFPASDAPSWTPIRVIGPPRRDEIGQGRP